jgi:predicted Fe-Mo cluster-binding NifX family protein
MKAQINTFESVVNEKCKAGRNKATPLKNLKKVSDDINYINGLVRDQKSKLEGNVQSQSDDVIERIRGYMLKLKESIEGEKKMALEMTGSVKEKNVDIVAMKRMLENRISQLSENMKVSSGNSGAKNDVLGSVSSNKAKFDEILELLNSIKEKTNFSYSVEPLVDNELTVNKNNNIKDENSMLKELKPYNLSPLNKENISLNTGFTMYQPTNFETELTGMKNFLPNPFKRAKPTGASCIVTNVPPEIKKKPLNNNIQKTQKSGNPFLSFGSGFAF